MSKPKLIICHPPYQAESLFHSEWFKPIIEKFFTLEIFDETKLYDKQTIFVVGCNKFYSDEYRKNFTDRKVIVDAVWESYTGKWAKLHDLLLPNQIIMYGNAANSSSENIIFVPNWFWYNESLWYMQRGYNQLNFTSNFQKKFLMPIGHWREWRQHIINQLTEFLPHSYYSCASQGILLPNTPTAKRMDTRYIDASWFEDTHYSIVVESARTWEQAVCFLTEKTYKVFAGHHPFMVLGAPGLLKLLKVQGFATFDNVFDESYDNLSNLDDKLKIITENIRQYTYGTITKSTKKRILHNFHHFYNRQVVENGLYNDVIFPILNWINQTAK
jgi:hypothetical protein